MKKCKVILMLLMLCFVLVGCSNVAATSSTFTSDNDSPEILLKSNPNADFFIMDATVYINATDIDWVTKLTLSEGKSLGKINKTGVKKEFQDWNATKLNVDTAMYELQGRKDIALAKVDNKYIPYLKWVEG